MKGPSMPPTLAMELISATPMAAAGPVRKVAGSAEMMPARLSLQPQLASMSLVLKADLHSGDSAGCSKHLSTKRWPAARR